MVSRWAAVIVERTKAVIATLGGTVPDDATIPARRTAARRATSASSKRTTPPASRSDVCAIRPLRRTDPV